MEDFKPGEVLISKYRIEKMLGQGAFGGVFLVTHTQYNALWALKVMRGDIIGADSQIFNEYRQHFQLEVQLDSKLDHPNIIRVFNYEQDGLTLLLSMEYAPYGSLADRIFKSRQERRAVSIDEGIQIALDVADGLAAIHAEGIVHRNLKPRNILISDRGIYKVTGLGSAQVSSGASLHGQFNPSIAHPGTPAYMSPEQESASGFLRPSSDVYTLGLILFELLAGRSYKTRPGTRLQSERGDTPQWFDDLMAQMLVEDPFKRPWDGSKVAKVLRDNLDQQKSRAMPSAQRPPVQPPYNPPVRPTVQHPTQIQPQVRATTQVQPRVLYNSIPQAQIEIGEQSSSEIDHIVAQPSVVNPPVEIPTRENNHRSQPCPEEIDQNLPAKIEPSQPEPVVNFSIAERDRQRLEFENRIKQQVEAKARVKADEDARRREEGRKKREVTENAWLKLGEQVRKEETKRFRFQNWLHRWGPIVGAILLAVILIVAVPNVNRLRALLPPFLRFGETSTVQAVVPSQIPPAPTIAPTSTLVPGATEPVAVIVPTITVTLDPNVLPPCEKTGQQWTSPKDGMAVLCIQAGDFVMGASDSDPLAQKSEKPQHKVNLNAYWIDRTEITISMYSNCIKDGACLKPLSLMSYTRKDYFTNTDYADFPVVNVTWNMASAYCNWAGRRLPSEAEWEKAARGTEGMTFPWGESIDCDKANYTGCNKDTIKVGSYPEGDSPSGALDMAGNAWEWVSDWYSGTYYTESSDTNPQGPTMGNARVVRGGSWADKPQNLRTTARNKGDSVALADIGFRCAMSK
jgi:formylglycine-generating enzyme required for sulfatase activity/serine/threonine protein kinase